MDVDKLIEEVIAGVKEEWPTSHKIRYVYLETGKGLAKNTDFFFSMDGKLGEANLTIDDLAVIYNDEKLAESTKVICKSSALILKKIYDRLGIKCRLVKSVNNVTEYKNGDEVLTVNHWMLAVSDEEDTIFCTLSSDLPYIQMGMATRHYGVNIPYFKTLPNGEKVQVYDGEEIKHTVIPYNKLKSIDIDLGYVKYYYSYNDEAQVTNEHQLQYNDASFLMIRDALKANRLFYELESYNTDFYKDVVDFVGCNGNRISFSDVDFSKLTSEDWDIWIKIVCKNVLQKIYDVTGCEFNVLPYIDNPSWDFDIWMLSLCVHVQSYIYKYFDKGLTNDFSDINIDVTDFKYSKWTRKVKKKFKYVNNEYDYNNLLSLLDKTNAIVNCVRSRGKNGNFRSLLASLSFHFILEENIMENNIDADGYLSNYYIANKFERLFKRLFGCNESVYDFNKMEYSEQVVIIKDILPLMFPELTLDNCSRMVGYNNDYSPVMNRIQIYPLKSKDDGYYSILFNIIGDNKQGDYYFLYDLKNNIFQVADALNVFDSYIIISERMKDRMSIKDIEDMGYSTSYRMK